MRKIMDKEETIVQERPIYRLCMMEVKGLALVRCCMLTPKVEPARHLPPIV